MSWQPPPPRAQAASNPTLEGPRFLVPTTIHQYAGTNAPITDTLQTINTDGVPAPMVLTGNVTHVKLQAQDADTGALVVDAEAAIIESGGLNVGKVSIQPDASVTTSPRRLIAWWHITLTGGAIVDTPEFLWEVTPHGVSPTGSTPLSGVCQAWATNDDINKYTPLAADDDYTSWLVEASELLYILSARQFPGTCSRTVRPQRATCGCWQVLSRGHLVTPIDWDWIAGSWWAESEAYQQPGCGVLSAVRLAGHAIAVSQVRISGSVVDPTTYRLDQHEWLVRLTDPATGQNPGWPACQDMSLPAGAAGTFEIDYTWGRTPPLAGVRAAATLAWQLYLNDNPQGRDKCKLPAGWTSITRQGITIQRAQIQKLTTEGTGIVGIDAFLSSANPNGIDREPAVYSRDVMPYAQRVG